MKKAKLINGIFYLFFSLLILAVGVAISNRWYTYSINVTHSLTGIVYVIKKNEPVAKGDYVGFRWRGDKFYSKDAIFVKVVKGVAGDVVTVKGNDVFINGEYVGTAKEKSARGLPLETIKPTVLKEGEYFVGTPNKDSYDSRYESVGTIKQKELIGRAYELF
ncbi:S26 family signal peptidase (plasmid) [Acinetobacter indicus]|uniref:S26 family signal peptidase n=1 Tax=Acinetobacter indicus TaxID=756892 RepID=UPI001FA75FC8|nr:S26 family signal peptidase [Acinetobacter indicus]UNW11122.1 S26 family signal peptidase [Acinetobacter indicus]